MKKLFIFLVLFASLAASAQVDTAHFRTPVSANPGYDYKGLGILPGGAFTLRNHRYPMAARDSGALCFDSGYIWLWSGHNWGFLKSNVYRLNDSMFVIGADTMKITASGGGGPFYDSTLMKSVYRARQDSSALATPPGNDQDVIFNDNTKYGADDGFTFSKAFREICVGCNIISGDAYYDGGGVTHGGVWLRSQNGPATVQGDTVTIQATAGSSSIVRLNTNNQERLRFNNSGDLFLPSLSAVTNDTAANKVQVFNTSTKKTGYMNWPAASGFTGITNQDSTLKGNGSTTPLRVNDNLVSYANYFNKGFPFNNQSIFYGTSIAFGFSGVALPFPTLVQQTLHNTTITNVAVSSCATRTASKKIAAIAPCPLNGPTIGDAAFNNSRWAAATFDTAALFGGIVNSGARDIAAMQFADNIQFYRTSAGSVNSNITTSGSAVTALPADTLADLGSRAVAFTTNIWWKQSITANETVTIANVRGAVLYIRVWADSLGGSRIQYAVDGVTIGTYNPNNKIIPGNIFDAPTGFIRGGIQNDAIIIHGLQDTLHTVVLTFLDGGTYGGFDCIGGLKTPQQAALTPMYVLDVEHMSSAGYSVTGGSSAMQDSCSNSKWNALQRAFPEYYAAFIRVNPNYPIGHYDANDPTQTQNNGGGDVGIHPSGLGHRNIALDILNAINPKAINSSGTGNTLDAALTAGNTSSQPMNLSGFSTTDSKLRIGAYEVYPASADVGILGHNIYIDGVNYKWRNSGYGTAILNFNNGILFRTFGNGSAGAVANSSLRTPFVTFDQNVGIGGNIAADASIAGATLQAMSTGDVNIPSGNLSVNQASNLGFATLEVHGTGYYNFPQNGNTFLSVHNATAGSSAAVNIQAVNDVNDIIKMGHYSSTTTPNNDLLAGMGYLEETGVAGLGLISDNSVGSISFMTNGLITRAKLDAAGNFMIGHSTSNGNGLLQVDGSGWFQKDQNGNTYLDVKNGNACAACQVNISTVNDLGHAISTGLYSSTTSPNGAFVADGGYVTTTASPGMALIAQNGDLKFAANGIAEQMRLKSGNLGIGTSSPDSALHVVGSGHFTKSLRIDALPAAPGTKTVRYNPANGQLSYGDTATSGSSLSLAVVGSSPNANGASYSGGTLNLQPASGSFPGVLTTGSQTIAGVKTFNSNPIVGSLSAHDSSAAASSTAYSDRAAAKAAHDTSDAHTTVFRTGFQATGTSPDTIDVNAHPFDFKQVDSINTTSTSQATIATYTCPSSIDAGGQMTLVILGSDVGDATTYYRQRTEVGWHVATGTMTVENTDNVFTPHTSGLGSPSISITATGNHILVKVTPGNGNSTNWKVIMISGSQTLLL